MRRRRSRGTEVPVAYVSEAEQLAREYWELSRSRLWMIRGLCALVAVAVAIAVLSALGVFRIGGSPSDHKVGEFELRNIGELATQAAYYSGEKTLTIERSVFMKDTYTFQYTAEVKAGLNFGAIEMQVDERQHAIRLKMPETNILDTSLEKFEQREANKTGTQPNAEEIKAVQQAAMDEATRIATDRGILAKARENAEELIRRLLAGGYDMSVYTIDFQWP